MKTNQFLTQLRHDFDLPEIFFEERKLTVGDQSLVLGVHENELYDRDVYSGHGRHYYQIFVNLVVSRLGLCPRPGSLAASLVLDREQLRRNRIQQALADQRIAILEDGDEMIAVEFELEGDDNERIGRTVSEAPRGPVMIEHRPTPASGMAGDEAVEAEYVGPLPDGWSA